MAWHEDPQIILFRSDLKRAIKQYLSEHPTEKISTESQNFEHLPVTIRSIALRLTHLIKDRSPLSDIEIHTKIFMCILVDQCLHSDDSFVFGPYEHS